MADDKMIDDRKTGHFDRSEGEWGRRETDKKRDESQQCMYGIACANWPESQVMEQAMQMVKMGMYGEWREASSLHYPHLVKVRQKCARQRCKKRKSNLPFSQ